ncbi:MAG: nucleotidyl transferase AbiEii/AbiGii toxin family protein [Bacilli bacterium]|jgi:predicted nucleotidyltransferase component of viral defense system|nr:nucleotidyl transferase AbiEii/AbiGii toxin family protein [Bacilli bacterium]MCI2055372.1 nucleotidyl transferase AbiEii/AbiGii toxin family protein [Bacilli bacterium]
MVLKDLLLHYPHGTLEEKENGLKEVVQEIALLGLSRTDFFSKAAFCGGTCLRLFYGLPRFSEDLDFALKKEDIAFSLEPYFGEVQRAFASFGFIVKIGSKENINERNVGSAFIKGDTLAHLISVFPESPEVKRIISNQATKVKFEVDVKPALGASYEERLDSFPSLHYVSAFDGPSLFAGKAHALICRAWKSRVKGRDLYDYLFYLEKGIPLKLSYFQNKLIQSGKINKGEVFGKEKAISLFAERFSSIDFNDASKDVIPFLFDKNEVSLWNSKLFIDSLSFLKFEE